MAFKVLRNWSPKKIGLHFPILKVADMNDLWLKKRWLYYGWTKPPPFLSLKESLNAYRNVQRTFWMGELCLVSSQITTVIVKNVWVINYLLLKFDISRMKLSRFQEVGWMNLMITSFRLLTFCLHAKAQKLLKKPGCQWQVEMYTITNCVSLANKVFIDTRFTFPMTNKVDRIFSVCYYALVEYPTRILWLSLKHSWFYRETKSFWSINDVNDSTD